MSTQARRTPPRHQLGPALRRIREARRRTAVDVATQLSWSESKLSRIETARSAITDSDLAALLDLYDVENAERSRLMDLAGQARQRRRPTSGAGIFAAYEAYSTYEADAASIEIYATATIPGLLQTPEYASAVIHATPVPEDHLAPERISTRMVRQAAVFARNPPATVHAILDEAALRRPIGGHQIMRRQMLRLIEAGESPHVTLQVLPFSIGAHPALTGPFVILTFAADTLPTCVYCDGLTGGVLRERKDDVARYISCFAALTNVALSPAKSLRVIEQIAESSRNGR
jgi:transcriptional regulator with XRE-family HTH domain